MPIQHDSNHREKEQETPHVSALSGLVDLAAVVEADEEARQLTENVVDLNALTSEISDLPKDPASPEVTAMVTKLLSRAEMLSSPEALAAVRAEADGLRSVPTWNEDNFREFEDVRRESRQTGVKVHFGKLMTITSIKFYELAKHLQEMKGRIVCRGDCAKDGEGAAAVYRELGANPTSARVVTPHGLQGFAGECHNNCRCYQGICPSILNIERTNLELTAPRAEAYVVAPKVCPTCSIAAKSALRSSRSRRSMGTAPEGSF